MAESTETLVERHSRLVVQQEEVTAEMETAQGPRWLRAADRQFSYQRRMWRIEDELLARAATDDHALGYMESYLGVVV